jgi:hypothetical protein
MLLILNYLDYATLTVGAAPAREQSFRKQKKTEA